MLFHLDSETNTDWKEQLPEHNRVEDLKAYKGLGNISLVDDSI
jgi:hypothetical protein